ncbi:MAG: Na+/H+ antiporter NhaC [Cryomorphaceae bacterium]|nr:Na+/H+ antiporter NhaC [Cryomorphaceae bacterium]
MPINMDVSRKSIFISLLPLVILLLALSVNVWVMGDESQDGGNQIILMASGMVAAILGLRRGTSWGKMMLGVEKNIASTIQAIVILLLIGALAGSWMAGGIVPAMIYYGMDIMHPGFFLPASAIIAAVVALVTGSSWSTTATVGIALMAVSNTMGISPAISAGAIISGAYFGDKLSPLSDTTNLAAAVAGTDVVSHIKYLSITTIPSFVIALAIFTGIALYQGFGVEGLSVDASMQHELQQLYHISPWFFLVPLLVIFLIAKKIPAIPALMVGIVGGVICFLVGQTDTLDFSSGWHSVYVQVYDLVLRDYEPANASEVLSDLLGTGGMAGMLPTIWLIIAAMFFGGIMEACGFLQILTLAMLGKSENDFSVFAATASSSVLVNVSASDQYLSIVIPGRMFKDSFEARKLAPVNLSRTLEDAGTVTSVLVPWNTCGAYQSAVLGVGTLTFLPFAFFNLLSPLMTLIFAYFSIKIKRL